MQVLLLVATIGLLVSICILLHKIYYNKKYPPGTGTLLTFTDTVSYWGPTEIIKRELDDKGYEITFWRIVKSTYKKVKGSKNSIVYVIEFWEKKEKSKKLSIAVSTFFLLLLVNTCLGQEVKIETKKSSPITFSGGIWVASNGKTSFIGLPGPKFTGTFSLNSKTKMEVGIMGIPGITLNKNPSLGLSAGPYISIKKSSWKLKPILGTMLRKSGSSWEVLPGIGILF